ncbi:Mn-containing catalase [Catalinimonas alkaloidigena]|uniref:Mn-containing catalase n=1 Tax=Catalinimonas alkaloidigena TaxID=1075417 RepID=A0A1G9BQP0_9BACT|nr:manganese catalase family protein [Catalinimonas alkaloidigena]SDK41756.1 Mn-containing catalase [Catalinimonas alkaloidigena]
MFYHDKKLQYNVRVEKPNPLFAKMLQQAIGGIEGEIRVCLQYLFQAWGARGPVKYRDMLLETGTEEMAHIEMLCTAVALNLEGAENVIKDQIAGANPVVEAVLGGMNPRHILSSGLAAMASDSNGVPFSGAYVVGTGNIAADMYSNVTAEAGGRALATRLYAMTDDPGMKDMLSFLIARDTMHQNQWLAVLEELGDVHPIPNSFPQDKENQEFSYSFISTDLQREPYERRWTTGTAPDGKGKFSFAVAEPHGQEPQLGPPIPEAFAQRQQVEQHPQTNGEVAGMSGTSRR